MRPAPIFTPPPPAEMLARLARVREAMARHGLDHFVAFAPDNVFYLTNFANFVHERPFVLVVSHGVPPRFVVPKLEVPHVRTRAVGELEVVTYAEYPAPAGEGWDDRLRHLLGVGGRIGVEPGCPLQIFHAIPGERVSSGILEDVRMVKSEYEIGRIAYGCALLSDAHRHFLTGARPGRALPQTATELSGMMLLRVLRDNPATNMLATRLTAVFQPPSVSHDPHNFTNIAMAMETGGPHVSVFNCVVNGYGAEIERTFFLGHVPEAARRPFDVMLEARRLAFALTVPGNVMGEVDRRVTEVFRTASYGDQRLHRTGHGIGVTGHEGPFLADGYERVIEPGMVFTIEPGLYLPGVGGFRHSDTVLTTANGNLTLTDGPEALAELTVPLP